MTDIAGESLIFRRGGFTPPLSLLMPTFAFPAAPGPLAGPIQRWRQCSPTGRATKRGPTASVTGVMPEEDPRPAARPVSCYALFE